MRPGNGNWRHLCVDMQCMFEEETPWQVSWLRSILPGIVALTERFAQRTVFTRFIPPERPEQMPGRWREYYEKWWMMTGEHLPAAMLDLVPSLGCFVPPAVVFNKRTYSPWVDGQLHASLQRQDVEQLVLTGGESDVCVLATVLGGIDLGYHVIVLKDSVCSGVDETYDASLKLLGDRFSSQVELLETQDFLRQA